MGLLEKGSVIAAIRTENELDKAIESEAKLIFDLSPDILSLDKRIDKVHSSGKKIFIHLDMASGIGKDKSGVLYAKMAGVDGIVSTRINIIKLAKEEKLATVQRFFIVDSHSVETTIDAIKSSKLDMIEIMPGVVIKVIKKLKELLDIPIIAGGLIETKEEIDLAIESGATAVSSGNQDLWN